MARDWALCKLDRLTVWNIRKVSLLLVSYFARNGWACTVHTSPHGSKYIWARQGNKLIRIRVSDHKPRCDMHETFDLNYWFIDMVDTVRLQRIVDDV